MKRIMLLLLLLPIFSEAQTWEWAKGSENGESEGYFCTTDGTGNIYACGNHWGSIQFGTDTVLGAGAYVVKYDNVGNVKWGISTNSVASSSGSLGLVADIFGNEYLLGIFDTTITFGGHTITRPGPHDFYYFIAKIDSSGNVKWLKSIGNMASCCDPYGSNCIATDEQGNIYATCSFSNNPTIGGYTLTSSGSNAVFVGKFDSSGSVIWAKSYIAGFTGGELPTGITVTPTHKIYISGYFNSDSLLFGTYLLVDSSSTHINNTGYLAKLDSIGNVVWAKGTGGSDGGDDFTGIITNSNEDVYLTGTYFSCTINLGSVSLPYPPSSSYGFLAKYDSLGSMSWVKLMQGNYAIPWNPAIDPCGNIWVSATLGNGICTDTIDGHIINAPSGSYDPMFIAGWNSAGAYLQGVALSSGGDDNNSISIDKCGNIYVEGDFEHENPFIVGTDSIMPSNSLEHNFLAKYNPNLGCNGTCDNGTLGIPLDTAQNVSKSLYPNPATTSLTITSGENIKTITITNLLGQTIYTHEYNADKVEVDVAGLPTGMYLIRINGSEVRKFVKE